MVITSIVGAGLRLAQRLAQAEYGVYRRAGWKPRYARGLTVTTGAGTVISSLNTPEEDGSIFQKPTSSKQPKAYRRYKRNAGSGYSNRFYSMRRGSKSGSYRSKSNRNRCTCRKYIPKRRSSRYY